MTDPRGGNTDPRLPPSKFGAGFTVGENDLAPEVAPRRYPPPQAYPAAPTDGHLPPGYPPPVGYPATPLGAYPSPAGPPLPPVYYPAPAPPAGYPGSPAPPTWAPPPGVTNSMAIAAFVCSFFLAPLGIIFGHIALSQINRTGEGGHGFAIAGLVIGYVWTGLLLLWWIALVG